MRWILVLTFFLFLPPLLAQQKTEFLFQSDRKKIRLRFQFINNLIVIPVTVNGQELTFLLDSGVGKTLLFNNENVSQLHFENKNRYNLSGLGQGEALQAYLTRGNTIQLGQLWGVNQDILLVDEIDFSFSRRMGRQIDGILGSEFFKTYPIKIDYINRKISVYNNRYPFTFPRKATQYPLQFHKNNCRTSHTMYCVRREQNVLSPIHTTKITNRVLMFVKVVEPHFMSQTISLILAPDGRHLIGGMTPILNMI